jgi:hypothetical protein
MRVLRLALAATLPLVVACADGTGPEPFDPSGSLSFSYRGSVSGRFDARGELPAADAPPPAAVQGAGADRQGAQVAVVAAATRPDGRVDVFTLLIGDASARGTVTLDPSGCIAGDGAACRSGAFVPALEWAEWTGTLPDPASVAARGFVLLSGEVVLTRVTPTRLVGTFRGVGLRASDPPGTLTVSEGRFDVPIRAQ